MIEAIADRDEYIDLLQNIGDGYEPVQTSPISDLLGQVANLASVFLNALSGNAEVEEVKPEELKVDTTINFNSTFQANDSYGEMNVYGDENAGDVSDSGSSTGQKAKKLTDLEAKDLAEELGKRLVSINAKVMGKLKKLKNQEEQNNIDEILKLPLEESYKTLLSGEKFKYMDMKA